MLDGFFSTYKTGEIKGKEERTKKQCQGSFNPRTGQCHLQGIVLAKEKPTTKGQALTEEILGDRC
jgi:hypothetical protein